MANGIMSCVLNEGKEKIYDVISAQSLSIDGTQIGIASPSSVSSFDPYVYPFTATAGIHTISFASTVWDGDHSAFLDLISIETVQPAPIPSFEDSRNFELPSLGASYQYQPDASLSGWTFSATGGIQGNGSVWGAPSAPSGSQTAFLQQVATVERTVTFGAGGNYTIGFAAANRPSDSAPHDQKIAVSIDGAQIGVASPSNVDCFHAYSYPFTTTPGAHIIRFASTLASGDHTVFLDSVSINPASTTVPTLVPNGSFEAPSIGSCFQYRPDPIVSGWTFQGDSGIQGNGSSWRGASAPNGQQTAFLQGRPGSTGLGTMLTTINITTPGTYSVSFKGALRYQDNQQIRVSVDGTQIGLASPPTGSSFTPYTYTFIATAGAHTLSFAATRQDDDRTAFVDAVSVDFVSAETSSLIGNGSFEVPTVGANFQYRPVAFGWEFTGQSGIQGNGSAWQAANAPNGTQTAFLQRTNDTPDGPGRMSATINLPTTAKYTVSFQAAQRANNSQQIKVSLDDKQIGLAAPTLTSFVPYAFSFVATAGTHTLSFEAAVNSGDNTAFVDAVSITVVDSSSNAATVGVKWGAFLSALNGPNAADAAAQYLVHGSRNKYRQAFLDLGDEVKNISSKLSDLSFLEVGPEYVRAVVTQNVNGQNFMRFVTFVLDQGEWNLLEL